MLFNVEEKGNTLMPQNTSRPVRSRRPDLATIANPAPLGLSAFALTTFVLSAANAQLFTGDLSSWASRSFTAAWPSSGRDVGVQGREHFGATAFSSYGAFWIAFGASVQMKWIPPRRIAFFLLGWTIFTR